MRSSVEGDNVRDHESGIILFLSLDMYSKSDKNNTPGKKFDVKALLLILKGDRSANYHNIYF